MAPSRTKVLLIDDEPELCELVKAYLSRSDEFDITTSNSVAEARHVMTSQRFDVIVSDYQMPKEDGIQLLKSMRSAGDTTPFILFTGKGREEVVIEAINSGADFYLQKGGKLAPMYSELAHKIRAAARRYRAESSLHHRESMYRVLFDRSVDPIALIDENDTIMSANKAAGALLDVAPESLVGADPRSFRQFKSESLEAFLSTVAASRRNGSARRVFRMEAEQGRPAWLELHLSSVDIGSGHVVTQIIIRDITMFRKERKMREEALNLHRELAANIPGMVYRLWLAPEKKIVFFNDVVTDLTGYQPEELVVGEVGCVEQVVLPDDRAMVTSAIRRAIESCEPFHVEYRIVRKDGRIRYVYESGRPKVGPDGGTIYIDGIVFDDNHRRMAMMRDAVTQEYFQLLFRNTSDMVVYHEMVRDADGRGVDYRLIGFNDAFTRVTGIERHKAEGALASEVYGTSPPPYIDLYDEVARTGAQKRFDTFFHPLERHFRVTTVKVGTDGFATITSDISSEVGKQKALERARDDLEESNQQLSALEEELRQQVESLEDGDSALRESEERYRMLVESSSDGVIIHKDGIVTFANQTMADILGYDGPKQLVGLNSLDFLDPSQRQEVAARVMRAAKTAQPALREKLMRKDGRIIETLVSARPLPTMGGNSAMVVISDISEEVAVHEEVKKLNADLTVQNEVNKIMLLESGKALETRLLEVILRELNSRVGFIGHLVEDRVLEIDAIDTGDGCHEPDRAMRFPRGAWIWGQAVEEGRAKRESAEGLRLPQGHIGLRSVLCAPLMHGETALGVISVGDREGGYGQEEERRLESIAAYMSPLIATILEKRRADEERKSAEMALEEANRKLQLLTGVTRHDIINQLSVLRGNLALVSKDSDPNVARRHMEKAMTAADNIELMVRFTKEYQEIGIQAPAWQCIREVAAKAKEGVKGLDIVSRLPEVEVWSDPLLIKVISNLLDNTIRHGVNATRVELSAMEKDGRFLIAYEDNGEGIRADDKERLFERGFGKNTGYGLFFAKEILEITNIDIREDGVPGQGARFVIDVPVGCWRPSKAT